MWLCLVFAMCAVSRSSLRHCVKNVLKANYVQACNDVHGKSCVCDLSQMNVYCTLLHCFLQMGTKSAVEGDNGDHCQ